MSKLAIAEQGQGFEIQKDVRDLLGFVPTQPNIHDQFDIADLHTHVKSVCVKSQRFPAGTIALSDAKTYRESVRAHSIVTAYYQRIDEEDIRIIRLAWYLIKPETILKLWGGMTIEHIIQFSDYNKSLGGDKHEKRAASKAWKKQNLGGLGNLISVHAKIGEAQNRVQASITTKRLLSVLTPLEYVTISLDEFKKTPHCTDTLPQKFQQLLPMLGRRYSHEQRFI